MRLACSDDARPSGTAAAVAASDCLWSAIQATDQFAEERTITPEGATSVALALEMFQPPLAAFQNLIQQPDFTPDMDLGRVSGSLGSYSVNRLPVLHYPTSSAEAGSSALLAQKAYDSFRAAARRTAFRGHSCAAGMRNAIDSMVASCWLSGDPTLARSLLNHLESVPPARPQIRTSSQQVHDWLFGYFIGTYRELHRSGQRLPLPSDPAGMDLIFALQQANSIQEDVGCQGTRSSDLSTSRTWAPGRPTSANSTSSEPTPGPSGTPSRWKAPWPTR